MTQKLVTVVGVGALGSHVVQFLRNEAQLRVIDFDRVEAKNTLAQFHGKPGNGKLKVAALQGTMQFMWGVKINTNSNKLVDSNVTALLQHSDLVIDCLDNGAARRLVQRYVRETSTPCLHGALAAGGAFGRVIWDEEFIIDDEPTGGAPTCEDGQHLPFIARVSAYLARAAQIWLRHGNQIGFSISPVNVISV